MTNKRFRMCHSICSNFVQPQFLFGIMVILAGAHSAPLRVSNRNFVHQVRHSTEIFLCFSCKSLQNTRHIPNNRNFSILNFFFWAYLKSCKSSYAGIIRIRLRVRAQRISAVKNDRFSSAPLIFYAVVRAYYTALVCICQVFFRIFRKICKILLRKADISAIMAIQIIERSFQS